MYAVRSYGSRRLDASIGWIPIWYHMEDHHMEDLALQLLQEISGWDKERCSNLLVETNGDLTMAVALACPDSHASPQVKS